MARAVAAERVAADAAPASAASVPADAWAAARVAAVVAERRKRRTPPTQPAGSPAVCPASGSSAPRRSPSTATKYLIVGDCRHCETSTDDAAATAAAEAGRIARFREDTREAPHRNRPSGPVPVRPGDLLGRQVWAAREELFTTLRFRS